MTPRLQQTTRTRMSPMFSPYTPVQAGLTARRLWLPGPQSQPQGLGMRCGGVTKGLDELSRLSLQAVVICRVIMAVC